MQKFRQKWKYPVQLVLRQGLLFETSERPLDMLLFKIGCIFPQFVLPSWFQWERQKCLENINRKITFRRSNCSTLTPSGLKCEGLARSLSFIVAKTNLYLIYLNVINLTKHILQLRVVKELQNLN